MTSKRMTTVPLPLSLHLAVYSLIGLFCAFAGLMNLLDPEKFVHAFAFLAVTGVSWGYAFGIYMARKEVVVLGFALSLGYAGFGLWQWPLHPLLGLLLFAIGVYGLAVLLYYRRQILELDSPAGLSPPS